MQRTTQLFIAALTLASLAACSDTSTAPEKAQAVTTDKQRMSTPTGDAPAANTPVDADPTPQSGTGGAVDTKAKQN